MHFTLTDERVDEAILCAKTLASTFREVWVMPDNLFPYFHACEAELERELSYVHKHFGVGVGAFTCQGVTNIMSFGFGFHKHI